MQDFFMVRLSSEGQSAFKQSVSYFNWMVLSTEVKNISETGYDR